MTIYNCFDLFLYIAMLVDLYFKNRKLNKIKVKYHNIYRYQSHNTSIRNCIYYVVIILCLIHICIRLYLIIFLHILTFNKVLIILPICCYYVLFDMFIDGIYFNEKMIYYKQELIEYRTIRYSYRTYQDKFYIYSIMYQTDKMGNREIEIKIKDQPSAYQLLSYIPFDEPNIK